MFRRHSLTIKRPLQPKDHFISQSEPRLNQQFINSDDLLAPSISHSPVSEVATPHTTRDDKKEDRFRTLKPDSKLLRYISPTPSELDISDRRELQWILHHRKQQGHTPRRRRTEIWDGTQLPTQLAHNLIKQGTLTPTTDDEPSFIPNSPSNSWICVACHESYINKTYPPPPKNDNTSDSQSTSNGSNTQRPSWTSQIKTKTIKNLKRWSPSCYASH